MYTVPFNSMILLDLHVKIATNNPVQCKRTLQCESHVSALYHHGDRDEFATTWQIHLTTLRGSVYMYEPFVPNFTWQKLVFIGRMPSSGQNV